MVGLVVVSHSPALAQAVLDLALEMVHGEPPMVAIAAGGPEGTFGTDAVAVQAAIEQVDDGAGVVVLMDLGSAVLSGEMALELLDPGLRDRVHLTSAPLVEGLVAAVVTAAAGEPPAAVIREAVAGLHGKETQLETAPEGLAETVPGDAERTMFTVTLPHGLHARPAARLVAEVKRFDATVQIRNATTDSGYAPAASLSRVAAIGARQGHDIEVVASGRQSRAVLDALLALAAQGFGEQVTAEITALPVGADIPLPASPGIGIGPKWTIGSGDVQVPEAVAAPEPEQEWRSLRAAVAATRNELTAVRARLLHAGDEPSAAIFDAHLLLLDDEEINEEVRSGVDRGATAASAWKTALLRVETDWARLDDPYMKARAADVGAVCNQVLRQLLGTRHKVTSLPGILVAADLTPNEIAHLDAALVAGIVTAHGSPTSHAAILARALGIPAVVGAGSSVLEVPDGTALIVDGSDGTVLIEPAADTIAAYRARADELAVVDAAARSRAQDPATTTDGMRIEVAANVSSNADVEAMAGSGADAVGVLRTEFFFIDRGQPPSASEQEAEYRHIAAALDGRRLTIRTLDLGGDKPVDYLPMPHEANPYLGLRGIRLSLHHPELLHQQLTAIVRVAADYPVAVMFPMVTAVAELDQALEMLDVVCREHGNRPEQLEVGMMVEVPVVATNAAAFTPKVDFMSIGTNDLAQYALATERGNENVAHLADALDPGVLRLIQSVVAAAEDDTRVAVCGELAADLVAVPILIGLGVEELSVTRFAVPGVKDEVRRWSRADAAALAAEVIALESAASVRAAVSEWVRRSS